MPIQKGRDFLIKIGNGAEPETFATLGAARAVAVVINNQPVDVTSMSADGFQEARTDAGVQSMEVAIDGLFRDAAAEETFRSSAFDRTEKNYQLIFPNGDVFESAFVIRSYHRSGATEGLESFSATLMRSGGGTFTPGA